MLIREDRQTEGIWEVGSGIVLRGRESRLHGEGPDGNP